MAEATVVGATKVKVTPDLSRFGPELRARLPEAVRDPAEQAGQVAGNAIAQKISERLARLRPTVKVGVTVDTKAARSELDKLTADRTVKVTAALDDRAARTALGRLTADRTVKIVARVDDTAAKTSLRSLSGQQTVDILPRVQQAAYRTAERQLAALVADRVVTIRVNVDGQAATTALQDLTRRRTVQVTADADTRAAATDIAALIQRRTVQITADADTTAAHAALTALSRDRTVNVRVRSTGLAAMSAALGGLGTSGGSGSAGLGLLSNRIFLIATAAASALPTLASMGTAIAQMGPAAALAAPALGLLAGAFAAIKVGVSGVGEAFKAAFNPLKSEANAAAAATKRVETSQRQLAQAQRSVTDAERGLVAAQRDARAAQAGLNAARREAIRSLQDMNAAVRRGALDQRQAALDIQQAEEDLARTRSDPTATQLEIQQAEARLESARLSAEEQSRQYQRLKADAAEANKAGVEGSEQVRAARERIRATNEQVAQRERALADAHRAVADAAKQMAEAQSAAAEQTSKLDEAMASLSPNARAFVNEVLAMQPAWEGLKLQVQDALFAGLGTRLSAMSTAIIPTLTTGLSGVATELNLMGREAMTAVTDLEKAGTLRQVFDGVRESLENLRSIPGQLVTGFAQLSVAAQPAFDRVTQGAAAVMDRVMAKLATGLKDGSLTEAINTGLDVALAFGRVLGDAFGIVRNIMSAASAGGGDFFATIGQALKEIREVTGSPEMQAALTTIFQGLNSIAKLLATTLGAVLKAVLPLLAELAPPIMRVTEILGPVLADLAKTLGDALMPIAKALGPVLVAAALAVGSIVKAFSPLLPVLGELIAALLPPLLPLIRVIAEVFNALSPVVAQVADVLGKALGPVITALGEVIAEIAQQFAKQFLQILQQLIPVIPLLVPVVMQLAKSIGEILTELAPLIPQIMLFAVQLVSQLLPALLPLVPPITQLSMLFLRLATWVITRVVIPALSGIISFLQGMRKKMQPAIDAVKWLTEGIAGAFQWLYDKLVGNSIIPDLINESIDWFKKLWRRGVEIFNTIKTKVTEIWDGLWGKVRSVASDAWTAVREGFDKFADKFKGAFRRLRDSLGDIWDGLKNLVKAPVRFWIETVYNRGIVSVWNKTAGKIPGVPDLSEMKLPKGFARGGILPGQSSWRDGDDQLVPMRRGEGVYVSEAMRDPYERARLYAINQAAMRGQNLNEVRARYGYAEGGIVGALKSVGSGIADGVGKVLSKGTDAVRGGLGDLAAAAFKPVKDGLRAALGRDTGTWPGMVAAAPINLINRAVDYIRGKDAETSGQWVKPVNAPYGTKFGVRGRMWASGRHTGLDFPAKVGAAVRAVASGRIASARSGGPYGKHLTVDHGGGLSSLYAHLSAMLVRAKDKVAAGQRIGSVGATGNVTGPHLHLEARVNGKPVDPMGYLDGDVGDPGGRGVQRWRGTVQRALREAGQSLSQVNTTLRRMDQESGGNPKAVNKWDINWKRGTPSVGLMQVIRPTFDAYAGRYRGKGPKLYGVSVDPMANLYASMRYALARYGSLSRAYNRPGGYALGGIVGRRTVTSHRSSSGYAKGGIIRIGGKRIDTGPIAASVGGDFLKALSGSASAIDAAMNKVVTALKNAFKGVNTTLDNKLISQLNSQNKALQALAKQRDAIAAKISEANAFALETSASGRQFAQMTSLPSGGNTFDAGGILSGMQVRLSQLRAFSKNLSILAQRGLSKQLLEQIIAAGPDSGAAYAQALVDATPEQLKGINETQLAITAASTSYGRAAADAMYDAGKQSGNGYLAGLKATEKSIVDQMSKLAKAIQKAIKSALKIKSPSLVTRAIGFDTGRGVEVGIKDATPRVVAATAQMAAAVRTTAAQVATHMDQRAYYGGDRHLHMSVTTSDMPTEQAVMRGWDHHDLLHRPVLIGG